MYYYTMQAILIAIMLAWIELKRQQYKNRPPEIETFKQHLAFQYKKETDRHWEKEVENFMLSGSWEEGLPGPKIIRTEEDYQELKDRYENIKNDYNVLKDRSKKINNHNIKMNKELQQLYYNHRIMSTPTGAYFDDYSSSNITSRTCEPVCTFLGKTPQEIQQAFNDVQKYKYIAQQGKREEPIYSSIGDKALICYDGFTWLLYDLRKKTFVGDLGFHDKKGKISLTAYRDPHKTQTDNPTPAFWEKTVNHELEEYIAGFSNVGDLFEEVKKL